MNIVIVLALLTTGIDGNGNIPWLRCTSTLSTLCIPTKEGNGNDGKTGAGIKGKYPIVKMASQELDVSHQFREFFDPDKDLSEYWQNTNRRRSDMLIAPYINNAGVQGAELLQLTGRRLKSNLKLTVDELVAKVGEASALTTHPGFARTVDNVVQLYKTQAQRAVAQLTSQLLVLADNVLNKMSGSGSQLTGLIKDAAILLRSAVKSVSDLLTSVTDALTEQVVILGDVAKDHATIVAGLLPSAADHGFRLTADATHLVSNGGSAMTRS